MWPQNIRWSVIGIEARRDPSPKREELGFVRPLEATWEHMWSSAFRWHSTPPTGPLLPLDHTHFLIARWR